MKKNSKNKGFTLIEILVVIGIIAILATIVLIAINPARQFKQARDSQRVANVNAVLNAIGQYIADHKGTSPTIPDAEVTSALCIQLVPTYLPAMPTDPSSDSKGASIVCSGLGANDVGYEVDDDATGRVTVSAPDTEIETNPDLDVDETVDSDEIISVTR